MAIVKHLVAETAADLEEISWRTHDAEFDPQQLAFDAHRQVVTVPFLQEPRDATEGVPASARVRSTWWFHEFAVPFLRCRLLIHNGTRVQVPEDVGELGSDLVSVAAGDGVVRVYTNVGAVEIDVSDLFVELLISDELADVRRRRVGRGWRWDSTSHWPPDRRSDMQRLVARAGDDAPALHDVSAIVRPPR